MREFGNIQAIPTPRLYVTRGFFVPEVRAAAAVAAGLASGDYFAPAVEVGPFDAGLASVAVSLSAGEYLAFVAPTVTGALGDAAASASLDVGLYFASILPAPASDLGAASVGVTLATSSYVLAVVALDPYPEHARVSAALDSGSYV